MAKHFATFYLEGGHEVNMKVSNLEVAIGDDGTLVSYNFDTLPEERISYLFFKPSSIVGVKTVLLEGDEDQPDSD